MNIDRFIKLLFSDSKCDERYSYPFHLPQARRGSCYKVLDSDATWYTSLRECLELEGNLVSIESKEENRHLKKVVLNDKKGQKKFLTHIYNCIPGFANLKQTYADDATTVAKIELFIEQCRDILGQHNFEPDRLVVINELPVSDDSSGGSAETEDEQEVEMRNQQGPRLGPVKGKEQWRAKVGRVVGN